MAAALAPHNQRDIDLGSLRNVLVPADTSHERRAQVVLRVPRPGLLAQRWATLSGAPTVPRNSGYEGGGNQFGHGQVSQGRPTSLPRSSNFRPGGLRPNPGR